MLSNDFDHKAPKGFFSLFSNLGILVPIFVYLVLRLFLGPTFYADSGFWLFHHGGIGELVDFSTNAFWQWSFEPVIVTLLDHLPYGYDLYLCGLLLLGTLGIQAYYELLPRIGIDIPPCAVGPALPGCLILALCGADTLVISILALFPWLLRDMCLLLSGYASARGVYWRLFFLSIISCLLLGQLALLTALFALIIASFDLELRNSRHLGLVVSIALGFPLLRLLCNPTPKFPDYPPDAHVVSAWGLVDRSRVLIGSEMEIQTFDWSYSRHLFQGFSILLFAVSLLLVIPNLSKRRAGWWREFRGAGALALILSLVLVLDSAFLPAALSQVMPIQSFARLIPEMNYLPLSRICCGLGFGFWGIWVGMLGSRFRGTAYLLLLFFLIQRLDAGRHIFSPMELAERKQPVLDLLKEAAEQQKQDAKILFSPSYSLIRERSLSALKQSQIAVPAVRVEEEKLRFTASVGSEALSFLSDKNPKTRWSSEAPQSGGEWIQVEFPQGAERLDGLVLEVGNFVTDFPRGLLLSSYQPDGTVCERQRFEPWEGSVEWSQGGFPFYGPQQLVKVRFFSPCRVNKLRIEQLGSDARFSWSVAELHLFVHPNS